MGPMLPIVNPVLWEIGHVGWFHEYWTLRRAHGDMPLLDRADLLWNSSTVAHDRRWDLDLPDRNGVFRYLSDVLARQLERLSGRIDIPASYFYELSIRHEDMHVEALTYTRQTLGYSQAESLGVTPTTVLRLIGLKQLPATQACTGAPWILRRADVERCVAGRKHSATPPTVDSAQLILEIS